MCARAERLARPRPRRWTRAGAVPLVALRVLLVLVLGGGVRARAAAGHGARNRELFEALRARVELDVLVAPRASGGTERSKAEPPRAMRLVDSFGRSLRCAAENTESGSGAAEVPVAAPGAPRESRRKQSASSAATSSINSRSEQTDEVAVTLIFSPECAQKQLGWWHTAGATCNRYDSFTWKRTGPPRPA